MSFPKAKLHRYYDDVSCAPPPGKYDPKYDEKIKGAVIEKGKRFSDAKMKSSSSIESLNSCCSSNVPIFRTPQPAKKTPMSGRKMVDNKMKYSSAVKLKTRLFPGQDDNQKLADQINELTQVHTSQLLEKNEEINSLLYQINVLNEKISNIQFESDSEKKDLRSNYESEINRLRKELIDLQAMLESDNEKHGEMLEELRYQITLLEQNVFNQTAINKDLEETILKNEEIFHGISSKVSEMATEFDRQIERFVFSIKLVEDVNNQIMEDYRNVIENFDQEKFLNLGNQITISELEEKLNDCQDQISRALKKCKMYEVVQTETSNTINVLSHRLMESEVEVVHLNEIHRDLSAKKESLEEDVIKLGEENNKIKQSIDAMQKSILAEVEGVQCELLAKLESYKQLATEESDKQKACLEEKQMAIEMLLSEIEFYKSQKIKLEDEVTFCRTKILNYSDEIANLKEKLNETESDFDDKISAQKTLFHNLTYKYENLSSQFANDKLLLETRVAQLSFDNTVLENECLSKRNEIEQLKQDIDAAFMNVVTLGNDKSKLGETLEEVKSELEELLIKHVAIEKELECSRQEVTNKTEENKDLLESVNESKAYIQTVTEHMVSLMNEISDKNGHIESMNNDIEIKNATLIQVSEEYEKLKVLLDKEVSLCAELQKHNSDMQGDHEKYLDEVISELVLEKERVSELSSMLEEQKRDREILQEEKNILYDELSNLAKSKKSESLDTLKYKEENEELNIVLNEMYRIRVDLEKDICDKQETIQILEYERLGQEFLIDTFNEERSNLYCLLGKQNEEIGALSETADKHFAACQELLKDNNTCNEEIVSLKEKVESYEKENATLSEEVENLKSKLETVDFGRNDLSRDTTENYVYEEQIEDLKATCAEFASQLKAVEQRKNDYKIYAVELEDEIKELKQSKLSLIEEQEELKQVSSEYSMRISSLEAQVADMETRNKELLDIIGPFKEQLMQFEAERNQLLSKNEMTEKELRALELEHAKSLGHQNHKQKIKHIVTLTETIADLKKEIEKARGENLKLRHELGLKRNGKKKNKENAIEPSSPTLKAMQDHCVSPTVLKERN